MDSPDSTRHYLKSRYREKVVEHIFVGELLRHLWANGMDGVEILTPEVDASGYDLVLALGAIVRHVQIKCSIDGGKTEEQQINARLALLNTKIVTRSRFTVLPDMTALVQALFSGGQAP